MVANSDPHAGQPVLRSGPSSKDARLVAIMLHGRGASAEDILGLAGQFTARDIAYRGAPGRRFDVVSAFVSRSHRAERTLARIGPASGRGPC